MSRGRKPSTDAPSCAAELPEVESGRTAPADTDQAPPSAASVRESALGHAQTALAILLDLARTAASEHVRVAAANAVLDRALGKPLPGAKAADEGASDTDGQGGVLEVRWLDDEDP